jgi:hypothetical protein
VRLQAEGLPDAMDGGWRVAAVCASAQPTHRAH